VHGTTPGRLVLDAQTYLEDWYLTLGYTRTGPDFDEDGIPHLPMERNG
jgi:ElaA protein